MFAPWLEVIRLWPGHGMQWNGRFYIQFWQFSFIPFPYHTKNLPFHTKIFIHIPSLRIFRLEAMQRIFCTFAMLLATTRKGAYNNTQMQRQVSGMHIARGFMRRRSQDLH